MLIKVRKINGAKSVIRLGTGKDAINYVFKHNIVIDNEFIDNLLQKKVNKCIN
jgi:hypothetical protein